MPSLEFRRVRSEEHTSELQSHSHLVCRLLLEKKKSSVAAHRARTPRRPRESATRPRLPPWCVSAPSPSRLTAPPPPASASADFFFFFNNTAPTEIYTLPLPAALPI